jgi:hypothetical protein
MKMLRNIFAVPLIAYGLAGSGGVYADEIEMHADIIRLVASSLGLNNAQFERSAAIILRYQGGRIKLSDLEKLSDDEVLNLIDYRNEPYANINSTKMLLTAKKYELEAKMLAEMANVPFDAFFNFYRQFPLLFNEAKNISNNKAIDGAATFSVEVITVTCDKSCQGIGNNVSTYGFAFQLQVNHDANRWENAAGRAAYGTTITIQDPDSGNTINVTKYLSSLEWNISGGITVCGDVACKK